VVSGRVFGVLRLGRRGGLAQDDSVLKLPAKAEARAIQAAALFHPDVALGHLDSFVAEGAPIAPATDLREEINSNAVLIFGGDGTIHRHLQPLIERKIPLLPVPVGSGNDFAAALGIRSVQDALTAWRAFCSGANNVREIDAGLIRAERPLENGAAMLETYFCNIAGLGLDSEANRLANGMPRWLRSRGGYILGALQAIASFGGALVTITAVGEATPKISEPGMLVAIANSSSYGSGMCIAPRAQLADGLFDVCFVRRTGRARLLRCFPSVFRGEHLAMPEVEYFQAASLAITAEPPLQLYADGEFICQTPLTISVLPRALRVIVTPGEHGS
jgi:diacylglycerol kinase (ATP)